jgi:vancomycin resistance protein YoaR
MRFSRLKRVRLAVLSGTLATGILVLLALVVRDRPDSVTPGFVHSGTPVSHIPRRSFLSQKKQESFDAKRAALLQSTLTLRIEEDIPGLIVSVWSIPLVERADWIIAEKTPLGVSATLKKESVYEYIGENIVPALPPVTHARIVQLPTEGEIRAKVEGSAKDGWSIALDEATERVTQSVAAGLVAISLPVQKIRGEVRNETGQNLGFLTLLARGKSDFAGSVPNRIFNIQKALDEHLNGVLVAPGKEFSFNSAIGNEVEERTGWKSALGIFNKEELQPTAGGGICQTSTTMYRAAIAAGLPIGAHRNHSMYIKYYRKYGEGLDATVYIGTQDLTFTNDTTGYLFVQAYAEGDKAFIEIYGSPDGRRVVLEGPYRKHDAPEEIRNHPSLRWGLTENSIAWRQRILRQDGSEAERILISRYHTEIPAEPAEEIAITIVDPLATAGTVDSDQQEQT